MSVYNGQQYLTEQLESILAQKYVDTHIYIRDDGSVDKTFDILTSYTERFKNISFHSGNNLGIKNSFITALKSAPGHADYYAFSDGDDVWLPEKLASAIEALEPKDTNIAQGYCSQITLVDHKLQFIREGSRLKRDITFGNALVECRMSGATAVFNKTARDHIVELDHVAAVMHDAWANLIICAMGEMHFDPQSHILYRQHASNADGGQKAFKKLWQDRLKRQEEIEKYIDQAKSLIEQCESKLSKNQIEDAISFIEIYRSFISRARFFINSSVYYQNWKSKILSVLLLKQS